MALFQDTILSEANANQMGNWDFINFLVDSVPTASSSVAYASRIMGQDVATFGDGKFATLKGRFRVYADLVGGTAAVVRLVSNLQAGDTEITGTQLTITPDVGFAWYDSAEFTITSGHYNTCWQLSLLSNDGTIETRAAILMLRGA